MAIAAIRGTSKKTSKRTRNGDAAGRRRKSPEPDAAPCRVPYVACRDLPRHIHPIRAAYIRAWEKKWVNGTCLHYYFFNRSDKAGTGGWAGPSAQKAVVRRAFHAWKDAGIGLDLREVTDAADAEIRVGFLMGDGCWSFLGRDAIDIAADPRERTMNFDADLTSSGGWSTALHMVGHALGFTHPHQTRPSGIIWNETAVIRHYGSAPHFLDPDAIRENILASRVTPAAGDATRSAASVMHCFIPRGLIDHPPGLRTGLVPARDLSAEDISMAQQAYPPMTRMTDEVLQLGVSAPLALAPGEQTNFRIQPLVTRDYSIQTFGASDTVMVLFEEIGGLSLFEEMDGEAEFVAGHDDSGEAGNARIDVRLLRDREYVLRVRLYYAARAGETAIMMW